jgi:chemotaxis protein MotB
MPEVEEQQQQPIIIIKKRGGHGGHHGGAWKVAYADFVTAMMAFFLVMWIVAQSQAIKESVAGYFNDPAGWGKKGSNSLLKGGKSLLNKNPAVKPIKPTEEQAREVLKKASEHIKNALSAIPDFASVKDLVEIEMTPEGLRIQLTEALKSKEDSSYFFGLGSAALSDKGEEILALIAKEIGQLDNSIVIEGHTDSRKYAGQTKYTNWELSADRANSARRLMESKGLKAEQVFEIRGYADKLPRFKDNPEDARNRRIAIMVLNNNGGVSAFDKKDMDELANRNASGSLDNSEKTGIPK